MGSPFANLVTDVVDVPNDAPNTITIQKLSGRCVELAQQIAAERMVEGRGYADKLARAIAAAREGSDFTLRALAADPMKGYDRQTILRGDPRKGIPGGITRWSYELECTVPAIDALDDDVSDAVALRILKLTKPYLFVDPEIERKND
jgi:hypothetical protein